MPFCPRCRCEYNVGVAECIDCHVPLVLYRPKARRLFDIDVDELLVPVGATLCMLGALFLLGLRQMATTGQLREPLGPMIAAQPVCLVVFYVVAAVMSALVVVISIFRWLFGRRY